ncbi:MAG: response regulator transcription factor [Nitrospirae bacterium]|nr:response regulator transcription factor [Nitrospirota bacterium]MBI3352210.1 response regulator transcription factor [Nitrospirota bacterium]
MPQHILTIEDEPDIAHLIKLYLEKEGFRVIHISDGARGLSEVLRLKPNLLILDLMLPGMDGLEICKKIRERPETRTLPVLMLTAKGEEVDKILGLEFGADDYLTKPFSPREMVARVKALLRRTNPSEPAAALKYGSLTLDPLRHEVRVNHEEVSLTSKEFGLLEILLKNRGRVQTRDSLLNQVWGYDYFGTTRTVDVHIGRIREKIPLLSEAIVTVKSLGYKIKDDE